MCTCIVYVWLARSWDFFAYLNWIDQERLRAQTYCSKRICSNCWLFEIQPPGTTMCQRAVNRRLHSIPHIRWIANMNTHFIAVVYVHVNHMTKRVSYRMNVAAFVWYDTRIDINTSKTNWFVGLYTIAAAAFIRTPRNVAMCVLGVHAQWHAARTHSCFDVSFLTSVSN